MIMKCLQVNRDRTFFFADDSSGDKFLKWGFYAEKVIYSNIDIESSVIATVFQSISDKFIYEALNE